MKFLRCSKCGESKPLTAFYRRSNRPRGYESECKVCKEAQKRRHAQSPQAKKLRNQYDRAYVSTEYGKQTRREASLRNYYKYPEKAQARWRVLDALQAGKLTKQPCAVCGARRVHGHHEDYSKPLDVIWLCTKHHRERHNATTNRR